jgi:hypothetical protein
MGLLDNGVQDAPATGLLGQGWNDPRSAAIMNLAGSMIRGDFGGGLIGANKGFQDAANANLQRADVAQQIGLRNIQLRQAQQQWEMMQPVYAKIAARLAGQGGTPVAGGAPADPSQPAIAPTAGGALGSGTFGIPVGGQSAAAPTTSTQGGAFAGSGGTPSGSGSLFGVPEDTAMLALAGKGLPGLAEAAVSYNSPTDLMKTMRASGIPEGSPLWNQTLQGNLAKTNYIAPLNARPGAIIRDPITMKPMAFNPHIPEGGTPQFDASGNVSSIAPLSGAAGVMRGVSEAQAGGKAAGTAPYDNPVTVPLSDGRSMTLSKPEYAAYNATGALPARYASLQAPGAPAPAAAAPPSTSPVAPGSQPGTDRVAIYQSELSQAQDRLNNPQKYMSPNDLMKDPQGVLFRQRAQGDINGIKAEMQRLGVSGAAAAPATAGAQSASPAVIGLSGGPSLTPSQQAPSEQMKADYANMAAAGPQATQSLEYLDHLLELAKNKPFYMGAGIGGLPGVDRVSTDAAEYEKARASYISAQGKALGSAGTDAARATIDQAVPEYGKPQDAMIRGLTDQRNQLVASMLRRQVLAPVYQTGNEKAYTALASGFDQNIKPSMLPVLSLPSSSKRDAIKAAIAKDPSLKPNYEWAFNNGLTQ